MSQTGHRLVKEITKTVTLDYLLHIPEKEEPRAADEKWPVILFLHGAGERGNDLNILKANGIPHIAEQDKSFPFIVISPQCPQSELWANEKEAVMAILEQVLENYPADKKRVYLTGLSMGGYGSWHLPMDYPDVFAAIAPVCGGGDPSKAKTLLNVPIWAFHGAKDDVVYVTESEKIVHALEALNADVKLTIYPEGGHDAWTETYANPELYTWFLSHSL
ncbi:MULTISPECIES: prolyl oligopeptidase family serine peptidase [Paenibacillus]|uniref:Dienelactone hydrolase family protein n=1 Tax=Paenibacillus pabuli TaxID=1472 RepID=A0A855XV81_9BACL|nr:MULTISPECIES: prolyl oligopeptidase family serine peptidase [Paenibacillus]PWW36733.1 dienelactone hydrolase family protein [Paenibacillus pabuli]PXW04160.1 dienelactone hydrolase family protein [Paenibacillus taichungensis]